MVVSPGKVVSSAPCAQPSRSASSRRFARQQPIEEARRESVAAAHAIVDIQFARSGRSASAPSTHATALQLCRLVECTSRSVVATTFTSRMLLHDPCRSCRRTRADRASKCAATSGPGNPSPFCRSSSLPTSTSTLSTMRARYTSVRALRRRRNLPQLLAEIQVERHHRARAPCAACIAFDDDSARRRRKRGEDAAAVEPAHARRRRSRSSRSRPASAAPRLVRAVVEHHRRARSVAAVAVDRGHVGAGHAVVGETLVERPARPSPRTRSAIRSPIG